MKILSAVHLLVSGSLNAQRLLVLGALEGQGFYGFSAILNSVQNLEGFSAILSIINRDLFFFFFNNY